ncbi:MAG TPA: glutamate racemase [Campylobacterales bacterium]|nr:glutamate racemase [Campylobacterales bacterium]
MKAGVFDSGVGGLTVVKSLLASGIFEEIIYYGDTARVPYGIKDKNTIIRYSLEALEFFKNFDIDIMITACNSVSAYAIKELQQSAPFPVTGVINPGVLALKNKIKDKDSSILILGTNATIKSGKYERVLKSHGFTNINSITPSLFVPIVEEGLFCGEVLDTTIKHYFKNTPTPDAIILGCTHFPLIGKPIQDYFHTSTMIHSGDAVVEYLIKEYNLSKKYSDTAITFFASENPDGLKKVAKNWLDLS